MKSFFKKVSLLLVLAMVVTMLPAKAASAALDDDGLYMRKKLTLYLNGDASGEIGDFGYATVKYDKETYTSVRFVSSNPEVAEVGSKKGGVTAIAVGEATVTATFTAEDGTTQTRDCKVVVKQNAAEVWVSDKGVAKLASLTVGDEPFQLKIGRKTADGLTEAWNQKGAITDGIRFASSDETVIKVGPTKGGVEVVGAGNAILYVWAVEGQRQNGGVDDGNPYIVECKDGKIAEDDPCYGYYKYLRTTEVQKYEVVVVAEEITAEQTTHKAFKVTFPTDAEAKAAAEKTAESLSKASAAVTEDTDIINVYEVLKNTGAAEEKASRMIGDVAVDGNVVIVTMFDEVEQETNYIITYQGKSVTVLTAKNIAVDMSIERKIEVRTETSSNVSIDYKLYTTGSNGQLVDITWCKAYGNGDWKASVALEDLSTEAYHSDYLFTKLASGGMIYFYTVDANNVVNLKATFEDWSQLTENKPYTIVKTLTVTAADSNVENVKLAGYAVTKDADIDHGNKVNEIIDKFAGAKKEFAATDSGYRLVVYATRSVNGVVEGICSAEDNRFTFVSANEDKLIINKDTGELYPAKEPRNDKVSVYVYYDGEYIGVCPITIWAERKLTTFTAELKSSTLSYNPEFGVDDVVGLELKPMDQLGDTYTDGVSFNAKVYMDSEAKYLDVVGNGGLKWSITGTSELKEKTIYSIRILCTATYSDGNGSQKEMRYVVTLRVKNTHDETERRYEIAPSGSYDLAVKDEDGLRINEKHITLAAYSYDRDGFRVKHLSLASAQSENAAGTATSDNTLVILVGNKPVPANQIIVTGNGEITDVQLITAKVTVASGSSEQLIRKIDTGTYVARLFVGDGSRAVYKTSCTINLTDSQGSINWKWVKFSTKMGAANDIEAAEAIDDCFDFGSNAIYVIGAEEDYVLKGNTLTVKRVRCRLPIVIGNQTYYYEIVTDINRTISVNN